MKGLGFSTILLAFVIVILVISVGVLGFLIYHVSATSNNTNTYETLWTNKKLILLAPTIMNVLSIAVLGALMFLG